MDVQNIVILIVKGQCYHLRIKAFLKLSRLLSIPTTNINWSTCMVSASLQCYTELQALKNHFSLLVILFGSVFPDSTVSHFNEIDFFYPTSLTHKEIFLQPQYDVLGILLYCSVLCVLIYVLLVLPKCTSSQPFPFLNISGRV